MADPVEPTLFAVRGWADPRTTDMELAARHYLGPCKRAQIAWVDERGTLVFSLPAARLLPNDGSWLELSRWCITSDEPNAGSRQWAEVRRALRDLRPDLTTVVSYTDPDHHTGALYRACNWQRAFTHHVGRNYPTGGGSWNGVDVATPKHRYVYPIRPDPRREAILSRE